ncbi:hypothetical protein Tery_1322 [Trichodesmium erythraeum IMS101]|uniref:Insertion element IS402-like domain-containing protein n=1 Tax=Trichodesmium erythraeum (strain IMS101) TaxID=203124 RepID=Q116D1_TRIEI|nr:transposase [Trichodesmium erythraeum GBRTRLIN201]
MIAPMLAMAFSETSRGRKQTVELPEVVNSILYSHRSGCTWELLPHDFPPAFTVYGCRKCQESWSLAMNSRSPTSS